MISRGLPDKGPQWECLRRRCYLLLAEINPRQEVGNNNRGIGVYEIRFEKIHIKCLNILLLNSYPKAAAMS